MGAAQSARRIGQPFAEFVKIVRGAIGEGVVSVGPHVLSGIEFRRIRGEVMHMEPRMMDQELPDLAPAMDRPAIPEQVDRSAEVTQEVTEEGLDIEAGEIVSATPEVETRRRWGDTARALQTDSRSCR